VAVALEQFWSLLETNFPLGGPHRHLVELVGPDVLDALRATEVLRYQRVADTYPCPRAGGDGCPRAIVHHEDGTIEAVCGNEPAECKDIQLSSEDVQFLAVDPLGLCQTTAKALQIRGTPEALSGLRHGYRVGTFVPEPGVRHPVYLIVRCAEKEYAEALDTLRSRQDGAAFAVLVPTERFISDDVARQMSSLGIPVLPLADVVGFEGNQLARLCDPLRYFAAIGRRGSGSLAVESTIVAKALVCDGSSSPRWLELDETGYGNLVAAADDYQIFADDRAKSVVKRNGSTADRKQNVKAAYFRIVRTAVEKQGYFDPAVDGPDEDQVSGKQIFQRARQVFDIRYNDAHGKPTWKLFKTEKVDNHAVYHFNRDPDVSFALIFLPES